MAARLIPPAPPAAGADRPKPRLFADSVAVVMHIVRRRELLLPVLAISWFWTFGATIIALLPDFAKNVLFADGHVVTLMLALFALGVGLGSIVAERLLHGEVSGRHVPVGGRDHGRRGDRPLLRQQRPRRRRPALTGVGAFVPTPANWRLLADLVGIAAGGGLFTVPLYAVLQHVSEPSHRVARHRRQQHHQRHRDGRRHRASSAALHRRRRGRAPGVRPVRPAPRSVVGLIATWILRRVLLQRLVRVVLRLLYRVEVEGLEHAQAALPHAVIAANHTSFLDGILLGAFLPGEPIFAIDTQIARKWWARPLTLLVNALPVDPTNPLSIRSMIRAVEAGSACVIFPEGRITTTGALMKVYEGPAVIAERTGAALVPVRIEGAEYSPFSRLGGKVRQRWFPKIRIRILPAERLAAPEGVVGRKRRVALRRALADAMVRSLVRHRADRHDADRRPARGPAHPRRRPSDRRRPGVRAAVLRPARHRLPRAGRAPRGADEAAASASASCCRRRARPWSRSSACCSTGRVPAMLNFSTGAASAEAACTAAEITRDRHRASLRREGQARSPGRGAVGEGDDRLPRGREAGDRPGPEADAPCSRPAA